MIEKNEMYLDNGDLAPGDGSLEARIKRIMSHKYSDLMLLISVALCFGALFVVSAVNQAEAQCALPH